MPTNKPYERLKPVLEYIENHLDEPLVVDTLSDVACLSKFHFHRQCSAYFGMSVLQLVTLLRMKRAAFQLAFRAETKVIDIALSNGYESHQAFSRAFKRIFGLTPSAFRRKPDWHSWHRHYEHLVQLRMQSMPQTEHYDIQIVDFPDIPLAVLEHRGSPRLLGASIQRFVTWRKRMELSPDKSRTFNLVYDDPRHTQDEDYRFDLGCECLLEQKSDDFGIIQKIIPSGQCARIRHIGSDDRLANPIDYLYSTWIDKEDWAVRDFPLFFERVNFFPEVPEAEMITDIYLPIRRE
jgi:AraC family transcriptional regulator